MKRTFEFDGDFRRNPKTNLFCVVCQKDLKPGSKYSYFYWSDCCTAVHPDAIDGTELLSPVGPECAKQFPNGFLTEL